MELTIKCTKAFPIYKYGKSVCYSCTITIEELDLNLLGYKAFVKQAGDKLNVIIKDPSETTYDYALQKPIKIPNVGFCNPAHKLKAYNAIVEYVSKKHKETELPEDLAKGFGHYLAKCFKKEKVNVVR